MSVQCQVVDIIPRHISREPAIFAKKFFGRSLYYGLYCFNHILQSNASTGQLSDH